MKNRRYYLFIFLISFAALMIEINYTRVFSFKLFYYFAYFVIGFSLLGLGSGGVCVAVFRRLREAALDRLLAVNCIGGAVSAGVSYVIIARVRLNLWGVFSSLGEASELLLISALLYVSFLFIGIMLAALLSRKDEVINRLYFADLLGAGLACAVVIPLMWLLSPPGCIFLSAALLAVAGMFISARQHRGLFAVCVLVAIPLAGGALAPRHLPDPIPDKDKEFDPSAIPDEALLFSEWGPVFRIDALAFPGEEDKARLLLHDGVFASSIHRFDGDPATLTRFDTDHRSIPFSVAPEKPKVLIMGAAGGHEILTSIHFGAEHTTAVELNPITVSLVKERFADFAGRVAERPDVAYVNGEGRTFLARDDNLYDIIYFVAPDSFAAMNAATSSAFVLSESYLYTTEMIEECLEHLTPDGLICMQYGEILYDAKPNRTTRYALTARKALERIGVTDPAGHLFVATSPDYFAVTSTILVKKTPATPEQTAAFVRQVGEVQNSYARHPLGEGLSPGPVNQAIEGDDEAVARLIESYPYDITPITDDAPFFWHFVRFRDVFTPRSDPGMAILHYDDCMGERILLMLLGLSALFAGTALLLPFVAIRETWRKLPHKSRSFVYFAALGLGFMFFEISLLQQFVLFLGYPTRSLSVTLMTMLVFAGLGSFASGWYSTSPRRSVFRLFLGLGVVAVLLGIGVKPILASLVGLPLPARIAIAIALMGPLGFCMGGFMPLGLRHVASLTDHKTEYVAWGWAVNGFFSVIGSVLTTILAMMLGFRLVYLLALLVYGVGVAALATLPASGKSTG
ncbi:MAG: hypothetical protein GY851_20375 [bacterium]|nr:hypothetical protein [bacterium]